MGAANCQRDCARVNDLWCSGSAVFTADCRTGGDGGACVVKVVLTYIVPYCVATYGAVAFRLDAMRRDVRALD
jgi:hypothetical protein